MLFADDRPLFLQIAESIEEQIVDGSLTEGAQAPSTNELAAFHRINPATAAKGINVLVDKGVLIKRRGVGMFVADGARELLLADRRDAFVAAYVAPLLAEARRIGFGSADVHALIERAETTTE